MVFKEYKEPDIWCLTAKPADTKLGCWLLRCCMSLYYSSPYASFTFNHPPVKLINLNAYKQHTSLQQAAVFAPHIKKKKNVIVWQASDRHRIPLIVMVPCCIVHLQCSISGLMVRGICPSFPHSGLNLPNLANK